MISALIQCSNSPLPLRAYLHSYGQEVYGGGDQTVKNAAFYLKDVVETRLKRKKLEGISYALGILWGNDQAKMLDFYGFSLENPDPKAWKEQNPLYSPIVIRNGIAIPHVFRGCGDALILLGAEEKHRRSSNDLEEYIIGPPIITDVQEDQTGLPYFRYNFDFQTGELTSGVPKTQLS